MATRPAPIRALVTNRVEADRLRALGDARRTGRRRRHRPGVARPGCSPGSTGAIDVIHTAGVIHPRTVADFEAVNAGGTRQRRSPLARQAGVRRFVHVSSNSPFGTNPHPGDRFRNDEPYHPYYGYGTSKMQAELAVLDAVAAGLDAVIVRPPWFYGPFQPPRQTTFFRMVRAGRFPVIGDGRPARARWCTSTTSSQGVVRAELVPTDPGRGWWIADARPYAITEIVETVGRALADEGFEVQPNTRAAAGDRRHGSPRRPTR